MISFFPITLHVHADGLGGEQYSQLLKRSNTIMATIQQVKEVVAAEAAEVKVRIDELEAEVKDLKAQVAAGGTITEAQLDEVLVDVQNIFVKGA